MNILLKRHFGLILIFIGIILAGISLSSTRIISYNLGDYITEIVTETTDITGSVDVFDKSIIHTLNITLTAVEYASLLTTYDLTGEKEYIPITVSIDGTTMADVGLRLKGTIDYIGLSGASGNIIYTPSLVLKFDKYQLGRTYQGQSELVLRSDSSEGLITQSLSYGIRTLLGLATPESGGYAKLSLGSLHSYDAHISESVTDAYLARTGLSETHVLYKSLSSLSLQYLGEDPTAYVGYFEQESSVNHDDMKLLINILRFVEQSDDATFGQDIGQYIHIENYLAFLALEEVLSSGEDRLLKLLDTYYIAIDRTSNQAQLISWDQNIALTDTTSLLLTDIIRTYIAKTGTANINMRDIEELISSTSSGQILSDKNTYQNTLKTRLLSIPAYRTRYENLKTEYREKLDTTTLSSLIDIPAGTLTESASSALIERIHATLNPTY